LVFGLLAFCYRQRRDLGAEFEAEIGSYQTVWAILHRLRSVLIARAGEFATRGRFNSPPEAGRSRHLRPVYSPPLAAGTEPFGEAEPSLTKHSSMEEENSSIRILKSFLMLVFFPRVYCVSNGDNYTKILTLLTIRVRSSSPRA
jgi:hypothetical protein